jgi:hypothetical protein
MAFGVGGSILFIDALGLCCGELVMAVLRGDGIGRLGFADATGNTKFVCTFSGADGSVGLDANGETGSVDLAAEYVVDGNGAALYVDDDN